MQPILDHIFGWEVFSFGVGILLVAGSQLVADEFKQYTAAKVCLYMAAAWIWGKVLMWSYLTSQGFQIRAFVAFLVFGAVGVGLSEMVRLIKVKADTNNQQQGEPKKPDVQQKSEGANSPNTNITGNNNTVINTVNIYPSKAGRAPFEFSEEIPETVTVMIDNGVGFHLSTDLKSELIKKEPFKGLLDLDGEKPITIYIQNGTFYVDASIGDGHGEVFHIKKTKLEVKPLNWDRNFSQSAVEIVDGNQHPVFQMIRRRANVIQICGLFVSSKGAKLDVRPSKTIFKYPAWKFQGEYAEAKEQPSQTPASGNLKQRTLQFADEIEREMNERQKLFPHLMTPEERRAANKSQSEYFRWTFLANVQSMHDEFAGLHVKNPRLDDFLKHLEMDNSLPTWPHYVSDTVEDLRALAKQLKD